MTLLLKQTEPEFAQIHRVADSLTPDLRRKFLAALDTLKRQIPLDTLADLIDKGAVGDIGQLIAGLDVEVRGLIEQVSRKAIQGVGDVTAAGFGLDFALDNPAVLRWISGNADDFLIGFQGETRKAVTSIVRQGFIEGVAPKPMARQIRRVIGLSDRDSGAVDRFWRKLIDDTDDIPFADRQADRMRNRLLRNRAESVARTETIRAANQGQLLAWEQAADDNLIDPDTTRRVWIATEDDRLCPICAVLDGQEIGFTESFDASREATEFKIEAAPPVAGTPQKDISVVTTRERRPAKGDRAKAERTPRTPPAHVRCRCSEGLVFDDE